MYRSRCQRSVVSFVLTAGLGLISFDASAQTWAANREGPDLPEIVTIDQTGETRWLWGREDVAGNELSVFDAAEQAIDGRAVYLTTAGNRLWFRLTLSATVAPDRNLVAYLFIDADQNTRTGRTAAAGEINPAFTEDPTDGGYEYVLAVRGDGTVHKLWSLNSEKTVFVEVTPSADEVRAESGVYLDPLRIGQDDRGYIQASIVQSRVGVNSQCGSRFFVRSTTDSVNLGEGDLDIGEAAFCVPTDENDDDVPDVLEPVVECNDSADCVGNAVCWNRRCWLAAVCIDDSDCAATEACIGGQCHVRGGDGCDGAADCGVLVCDNRQCVACTTDASCGSGRVCGPYGRCVDEAVADEQATNSGGAGNNNGGAGNNNGAGTAGTGVVLDEGERVQGGACACHAAGQSRRRYTSLFVLLGLALFARRNPRRELAR